MNEYRMKYETKKKQVEELVRTGIGFAQNTKREKVVEILNTLLENLEKDEFSIVIVGEFSAGKSTFLNALMGEKILPSFTNETTATVNFLKHREKSLNGECGRVYYFDGKTEALESIDQGVISKYVSTKSDISVAQSVEHVDLYLDSKFLEGNVTLVDSPGLNGTADGHRDITQDQIDKSSASIFMFRADQPGSKSDFEFLKELKHRVNKIIFVLNKIDDIKASEEETVESVIESIKENYKKTFPEDTTMPEIWGISAYQALVARSDQKLSYRDREDYSEEEKAVLLEKSRMEAFENRLWKFLTQGEKAKEQLLSPTVKVKSILEDIKRELTEEREQLENKSDGAEIADEIIRLEKQIEEMNKRAKSLESSVQQELMGLNQEAKEAIAAKVENFKATQIRKLNLWTDLDDLEEYEESLERQVQRGMQKIIQEVEEEYMDGVRDIVVRKYEDIAMDINNQLKELSFEIKIESKYQPLESTYSLGIEQYEELMNNIEEQIREKVAMLENSELSLIKARNIEREKHKLEEQLSAVKDQKRFYEQGLIPPSKREYQEQCMEKQSRGGLLGLIGTFLVGKKSVQTTVTKIDDSEVVEWKKEVEKNKMEYEKEIAIYNEKLEKITSSGQSSEEIEYQQRNARKELEKLENKLENAQKEFKERYEKKNEKLFKTKRSEIEEYFEDCAIELKNEFMREVKQQRTVIVNTIKQAVSLEVIQGLEQKKKELEHLTSKLESSEEHKKQFLADIAEQLECLKEVETQCIELLMDMSMQEIDEIQQISL